MIDKCAPSLNFLERQFEEAKEERKAWFFCRGRPALYGHTSSKCPFLDLSIQCRHCKTPGKSLKACIHCYSKMEEKECSCCDRCHYSQFARKKKLGKDLMELLVFARMASDPQIPVTVEEYNIRHDEIMQICRRK